MVKKRKKLHRKNSEPLPIADEILKFLEKIGGCHEKSRLSELWKNWQPIMGDEIAANTVEIFAKEKTLILKTHDAMSMQELSFQKKNILENANSFLGSSYFQKINLIL